MNGIQYLTNEAGERTYVLIDLKEYGELWEDFHDGILAEQRKNEPLVDWEEVKRQLAHSDELPS